MPIVETPLGQIETVVHGSAGLLFVMVHAAGAGPRSFDRLVTLLGSVERRFIAPARPGYGETVIATDGNIIERNVAVIDALTDTSETGDCVLVGHSMGGLVSLLAAISRARQDRRSVRAVILYDPILISLLRSDIVEERDALEWDRSIIAELNRGIAGGQPESGVRSFIEAWSGHPWTALPEPVRAHFVELADTLLEETLATSHYPLDPKHIAMIDTPVLLLTGKHSPRVAHMMAQRAAELLPNARIAFVEEADHMGPVNNPKSIAPVIENFLERLS